MAVHFHNSAVAELVSGGLSLPSLDRLEERLNREGTFEFRALPNGLFPAAIADDYTGYSNIWVRDNMHLAHQFWALGETERAVANLRGMLQFFATQEAKIDALIAGRLDPDEPMNRPHIRFNGTRLCENPEQWAHAQNDALGYFLWMACELIHAGKLQPTPAELRLLLKFAPLFKALQYWNDKDSGHWEEKRKVEASSIGTALRGLLSLQAILLETSELPQHVPTGQSFDQIIFELRLRGEEALMEILPWECRWTEPKEAPRRYDAALLFLIYPLKLIAANSPIAEQILTDVRENLQGDVGIRRYLGDSYWCADYKDKLPEESLTADVSDDMSARDALLRPGEEAQWCIFDPILSVIYGLRFQAGGSPDDRILQETYLLRSLAQITSETGEKPAFRCPESYYLVKGVYTPNDVTPLLWTQANLRLALRQMRVTLT